MNGQNTLREPVFAGVPEADAIKLLVEVLSASSPQVKLVGGDGEVHPMPESVTLVLQRVIQVMASGRGVSLESWNRDFTIAEAAELLSGTRQFIIKLLEQGEIPYRQVNGDCRMKFEDVMAYKHQRDIQRREGLKELTRFSQELGLYDLDYKFDEEDNH